VKSSEFTVITAVIDKLEMMRQPHWENKHPYHYLMEIMVEKYTQWLERKLSFGDIMPEKRRGPADPALQTAFEEVRANGTRFVTAQRIQAKLQRPDLLLRGKRDNIAGLQLCDLLAHPSQCHVRVEQGHQVTPGTFAKSMIEILTANKYDRSFRGAIPGYGTKYLP
jgi:hypothetical protein